MSKLNTIIVDDHPLVADGLKMYLSDNANILFKDTFYTGLSVLEYPDLKNIHLIFMDIFLPDINGIDLCLKVKKINPNIKIIAISSQSERSLVFQMLKAGSSGYFLKTASITEFNEGIKSILDDEMAFCNEVKDIVNTVSLNSINKIPRLTKREKEIIILLKQGKTTQEVSDALFLSFLTVQTHRRNLLNKFSVNNLVELINLVDQNGLI